MKKRAPELQLVKFPFSAVINLDIQIKSRRYLSRLVTRIIMAYASVVRPVFQRVASKNVLRPKDFTAITQFLPASSCYNCHQQRQIHGNGIQETFTRINSCYPRIIASGERSASNTAEMNSNEKQNLSFWSKTSMRLQAIARKVFRKSILAVSAKNIYECCADQVDYKEFFKLCSLPDTFQSWFQVVHLHFWMCYIRLKSEGKEGQIVQRQMTECMWEDIKERMKILGVEDPSLIKKNFKELAEQFYGVTISYNKGYLADDEKVFTQALWRNLFGENADRRNVEVVMRFVTEQMNHLEDMDSEEILTEGKIQWLPIKEFIGKS